MVLSDATIARLLAEGRILIDPYDEELLQPSSVDVRVDRFFRVFHNNRYPFIDVKKEQEDLTELVEVDGDSPFVLHPGEFVLGSTLERVRLPDDIVARLEGKALALETEVPTPSGWRTIADIERGDVVYDEDGAPSLVLDATRPLLGRPCRRVSFADGSTVIADAHHLWRTKEKRIWSDGIRDGQIRTTDEIGRTLRNGDEFNHHVPLAGAVWYPERELPIDPYVLGISIEDGADQEIVHEVEAAGTRVAAQGTPRLGYRTGGVGYA